MAGYFIQQDWTEKPPSGTPLRRDGHWSVQGLAGCWALNEGGGRIAFDLANQKNGTIVAAPWTSGGLAFTSAGQRVNTNASLANSPSTFSLFGVFKGINLATAGRIVGNHSGINYGALLAVTSVPFKVRFLVQTSTAVIPIGATTIINGRTYTAAGVYDGSTARVYLDGKQDAELPQTGNIVNSSNNINIGADADGATFLNGAVFLSLIYSRALSPAEIASLSTNPWQVFEPRTIWVEVGGGAITFNPAWAAGCNQIIGGGCYVS